jgi:hypothetical protein
MSGIISTRAVARSLGLSETALRKAERAGRIARDEARAELLPNSGIAIDGDLHARVLGFVFLGRGLVEIDSVAALERGDFDGSRRI